MGSKTSTKTKRTPYDPTAVANANSTLAGANTAAQGTIAANSPALQAAIDRIQTNIAAPPAYLTGAREQLGKTIGGDYLDPSTNPHAAGIADLIAKRTQGGYNASFGASGRSHGGLAALLSSQGVGDALGQFYGNMYEQERGRQQQATMAAPAFHADEYTDMNALFPAVSNLAMLPLNAANAFGAGVTNVNAPYTTEKTTQKTGGMGGLLGTGLGLASMIGGAFFPPAGLLPAGAGGALGGISNPYGMGGLSGMMKVLG